MSNDGKHHFHLKYGLLFFRIFYYNTLTRRFGSDARGDRIYWVFFWATGPIQELFRFHV